MSPTGTRATAVAVAVAVVLGGITAGAVAPAGGSTTTAGEFVYLTTSTTPAQPTPGEEFTYTVTFDAVEHNDGPVRIERVELRDGEGRDAEVLAEQSYYGGDGPSVPPGGSVAEDLAVEFAEAGTHDVVVRATVVVDGRRATVEYPATVTVYEPAPRVEASAEPTAAGERTTMRVTVANGLAEPVRDVEVTVEAADVSFEERSRVAASVDGGASETLAFTATPSSLGSHAVDVTVEYTDSDGARRSVERTVDVRFDTSARDSDLGLSAEVAPAMPGGTTTLNLTVANGFDRAIRQLEVRIAAGNATVQQPTRVGTGVESGAERTFTFDVSRPEPGREPVDVTVAYTTADGTRGTVTETLTTTFAAPANPGEIRLTGVDAVARGGQLRISATASNVGSTDVEAVVVSVGDGPAVAPADYFVGAVEASDFASFTLETSLAGNVSTVPVEVTYVVDGVEQSLTREVRVQQAAVERPGDGGGSLPVLPAVGLVVLVVVGAVVYRRRG